MGQALLFSDAEPGDHRDGGLSSGLLPSLALGEADQRLEPIPYSSDVALGAVVGLVTPQLFSPPPPEHFRFKNIEFTSEEGSIVADDDIECPCTTVNISLRNMNAGEVIRISLCGLRNAYSATYLYEELERHSSPDRSNAGMVTKHDLQNLLEYAVGLGAHINSDAGATPEGIATAYELRTGAEFNRSARSEISTISRTDGKAKTITEFKPEMIKTGSDVVWIDIDASMPSGILDRNSVQQLVEKSFPKLFSSDGSRPHGRSRDFEFFDVRLYEEEHNADALFAVKRKKVGVFVGENLFVTIHDGPAAQISKVRDQYLHATVENPKEIGAGSIFLDLMFESARSADRILDGFEQTIEDIEGHYGKKRRFPSERVLTHEFPRIREGTDYMAAKFSEIDSAFHVLSRSIGKTHFENMFGSLDADTAKQDIEYVEGQVASRGKKASRLRERIDYLVSTHNTVVNTRAETIQAKLAIIAGIAIPLSLGPSIASILQDPKPGGVATLAASAVISLGLFGWGVWKRALHI